METIRQTSFRDPNSFNMVQTIETGNRTIFKKVDVDELSEFNLHEPSTLTLDQFRQKLDEIGQVTRFETYIDADSLFEITRGSVIRNGIEHFFHVMYPSGSLYTSYVTGAISVIEYTKGVVDGI